jgi:hypothetical protein
MRSARSRVAAACASVKRACSSRPGNSSGSGLRVSAVMASRRADRAGAGVRLEAAVSGAGVSGGQGPFMAMSCAGRPAVGWVGGRFDQAVSAARRAGAMADATKAAEAATGLGSSRSTPNRFFGSVASGTSSTISPMPSSAAASRMNVSAE